MAKAKKPDFVKLHSLRNPAVPAQGSDEVFIRPGYVRLVCPHRLGGATLDLTSGGALHVTESVADVMALINPLDADS